MSNSDDRLAELAGGAKRFNMTDCTAVISQKDNLDIIDALTELQSLRAAAPSGDEVEAALGERIPGGSEVWHWIAHGGMQIDDIHREIMRAALSAAAKVRKGRDGAKAESWTRDDLMEALQIVGWDDVTQDAVDDILAHLSLCSALSAQEVK